MAYFLKNLAIFGYIIARVSFLLVEIIDYYFIFNIFAYVRMVIKYSKKYLIKSNICHKF